MMITTVTSALAPGHRTFDYVGRNGLYLSREKRASNLARVLIDLVTKDGCTDPEVVLATLHGCPKELR